MQTDGTTGVPEQPGVPLAGDAAAPTPARAAADELTDREVIELFASGRRPSHIRIALRRLRRRPQPPA
jgi:hypothetical protein